MIQPVGDILTVKRYMMEALGWNIPEMMKKTEKKRRMKSVEELCLYIPKTLEDARIDYKFKTNQDV